MSNDRRDRHARSHLPVENEELRLQIEKVRQTLKAIRRGNVDALAAAGPRGERVLTTAGAECRQALEESEARFLAIFESSLDAIAIANDEGVYVQANPAVRAVFGLPPEKLIGRQVSKFVDKAIDFPALWRDFLATGSFQGEIPVIDADGQMRHVEAYAIANVLPGRHLAVIRDITERKQAEQTLRRSSQFPEENPNPVLRIGSDGALLYANAPARDWLATMGWQADGPLPAPVRSLAAEAHAQDHAIEREISNPAGATFWLSAVRPPGEQYSNLYGRDVTERKHAEEALRELNATLERKVTARTEELQHRAGQLQKLTLELSQAEDLERKRIAEILHDDLQQILAAAKFHLNSIRNRARYDPSTQTTAAQIDHMLKDAIDKSRALSHELSPAVLHHGDFRETLGWLAAQIQIKHGLLVHVDAFSKVDLHSDALRAFLYKAARELLFNVVKHARVNEARIRIRRWGSCICLSVSDRGRGFDPQDLKATTGFGLFSIRERIELLGGRMKIKSAKGHGSTFHIVVPDGEITKKSTAIASIAPAKETKPAQGDGQRRLRVLIADDHEIVREGLISLLSDKHSIQVVGEAANGREAVDLADQLRPDVVIMDVAMPLIDGDEATRQIKQHMPDTRVIALSMYEEHENVEKMLRAGAEAYILKTAPAEQLLAAIRGQTPTS